MTKSIWLPILLAAWLVGGCTQDADGPSPAPEAATAEPAEFEATVHWTSYGVPHVVADDWKGLGYGFAYATAADAVCVIARDLVMVNGQQSRYFGPGDGRLEADVFHRGVLTEDRLARFRDSQSERALAFSRGYVTGYNRYLRDHGDALPVSCAGEQWVRAMDDEDLVRLTLGVGIRYGLGRTQKEVALAGPPVDEAGVAVRTDFSAPAGYGSNAVAFGKAVTESGRGILLGNPHYPWHGSSRFHLIHTTIPGEVDVMGVSLLTTSRVSIGFNQDIAWSHTVSTGLRSTFYELTLHPSDPMQYRYGDDYRPIETVTVPVEVRTDEGKLETVEKRVFMTHFGPIVESEQLPWTHERAYAVRDANLDNDRAAETYDALNKATSVNEVEAALHRQGVAWTNTIAADRHGGAFYADISVTPNVDVELLDDCRRTLPEGGTRIVVLDGSDPACEWRDDPRSGIPGVLPPDAMPRLHRSDYVANSNDSYWLSNPAEPLEGYSPIIGNERTARSLRTRAGLHFIREAIDRGPVTPDDVQEMLFSHRNFGAELLLDDVLEVCTGDRQPVTVTDRTVDIQPACKVLGVWDRTAGVDSRGAHLWREFWRTAREIEDLYRVPFDPEKPVSTPRGIAIDQPAVAAGVREALAAAQITLTDAGIALDARLGDVQFAERNGERIPIPGGEGWAGMWSMIVSNLEPGVGYNPIVHGNSYVQVISWDQAGRLDPRALVTYSQSPEPESPHYADMTRLYSEGRWVKLPFTAEEIAADPNRVTLALAE
jgi:acyl-homoserine-lactone acylase